MTKKDFMSRIKTQLKALITSEKFAEARCGDMLITTPGENFEVGGEVYYTDESGNNVPLNEGDYTLDNGLQISVQGGKVVEISKPEMVEDTQPAEMSSEEPVKIEQEAQTGIDMAEYGQMKERLAKCEMMIEKMMKDKEMMEVKMNEISSLPSERPIQVKPTENQPLSFKKENASMESIMDIRERARKNRSKSI